MLPLPATIRTVRVAFTRILPYAADGDIVNDVRLCQAVAMSFKTPGRSA